MILRAKHHTFIYPFFKLYTQWLIKLNFSGVFIDGSFTGTNKPVLLIANHSSWWDGFWALYLNIKILKRKFHFMMLEEQLRKHWYFNYAGGYSVRKNSKSIIETLQYTKELLKEPDNTVLLFPQGKISSIYSPSVKFEKGVEYILNGTADAVNIIFQVNLTDYFSSKKPEIHIYFKEYSDNEITHEKLENAYNSFYKSCIEKQGAITV